jgi:hypothetical protein
MPKRKKTTTPVNNAPTFETIESSESNDRDEGGIGNQATLEQMSNVSQDEGTGILDMISLDPTLETLESSEDEGGRVPSLDDVQIQQPNLRDPVEPNPGTLQDRLVTDTRRDPRDVQKGEYMSIPRERFEECGVGIGKDVKFSAQEKSDGKDTYLNAQGTTNVEHLDQDQIAGLNVSGDGRLAIESEAGDRQAKMFFIDKSLMAASNNDLAKVGSQYRLVEAGGRIKVPVAGSDKTRELVLVSAENQDDKSTGDDLSGIENCDGMAANVTGWKIDGNSRLVVDGSMKDTPDIGETYTGTRGAAYFNEYARRKEKKDWTGKKKGAKNKAEFKPARAPLLQEHSYQMYIRGGEGPEWVKSMTTWLNKSIQIPGSPYYDEANHRLMVVASEDQREQLLAEAKEHDVEVEDAQTFTKDIDPGKGAHDAVAADQLDDIADDYMNMAPKLKDKTAKDLEMNEYCNPKVGDAFGIFASGGVRDKKRKNFGNNGQDEDVTWGQHWGGVVARSAGAFVTLENYDRQSEDRNSQDRRSKNGNETRVFFRMYGSVPDQNWHDKNMEGGNFQNPISMVFRNKDR